MVSAQQAVLSSSANCPEDFQMVMSFVSNDDDTDNNVKSISGTGSSRERILSTAVSQNIQIKLSNVAIKFTKHLQRSYSFFFHEMV